VTVPGIETRSRHLDWAGCRNARDLGGLPAIDGGETRWQAVVRSDLPLGLADEDLQAILEYGIRTVIDLRGPQEVREQPSLFALANSQPHALTCLHLPIERYEPHVSALISKSGSRAEVYCIILDHYPDMVAAVMATIADAQPGGVIIHCHSGTDRTGMISGVLLGLAGVLPNVIVDDYAESQLRLRPGYGPQDWERDRAAGVHFWLRPTATAAMMSAMLAHLDDSYGGARGYLTAAGMADQQIERLLRRLR
jgi:protein-tyrosine phosphatase